MKVEIKNTYGTWREIADAARTTIGMEAGEGEPKSSWKKRMLLAEHSPIRKLKISAKFTGLLSWVSVHFVRHKHGIEHWVQSQRTDRTGRDRNELPQSELVDHEFEANAQAIINISRKRLCSLASPETRIAWSLFLAHIEKNNPELAVISVPDCIYRGHCYEYSSCGYHHTEDFKERLADYRAGVNEQVLGES